MHYDVINQDKKSVVAHLLASEEKTVFVLKKYSVFFKL